MAKLSSQFYATPSEVASFVRDVVGKHRVEKALVRKVPFSVEQVVSEEQLSESSVRAADWVVFTLAAIDESPADVPAFRRAHPDAMTLEVGRFSEAGLQESWLHAQSENATAMAVWGRIARDLRGRTYAGVAAVNATSGVIGPILRAWRCTVGARDLYARGVRILPAAGTARLAIIEPPGSGSVAK